MSRYVTVCHGMSPFRGGRLFQFDQEDNYGPDENQGHEQDWDQDSKATRPFEAGFLLGLLVRTVIEISRSFRSVRLHRSHRLSGRSAPLHRPKNAIGLNRPKVCHVRHAPNCQVVKQIGRKACVVAATEHRQMTCVMECHGVSWSVMGCHGMYVISCVQFGQLARSLNRLNEVTLLADARSGRAYD
jgi:hypothetical protein